MTRKNRNISRCFIKTWPHESSDCSDLDRNSCQKRRNWIRLVLHSFDPRKKNPKCLFCNSPHKELKWTLMDKYILLYLHVLSTKELRPVQIFFIKQNARLSFGSSKFLYLLLNSIQLLLNSILFIYLFQWYIFSCV